MPREIPFNRPSIVGNEIQFIREAIRRGQLAGDGFFTKRCNAEIEAMTGAKRALITHSCTAALEMAAILCDIQPGDEVIMPSFTFVSTANAVVLRGGVPVFVDIDANTLNIDPVAVADAVTPRTKAIFAVHYAGFPAEMDALADVAKTHGLLVVEDAAQALGSFYKGRSAGSLGDMAAFSFHETKNIVSGEGGALAVNRPELVDRAEIIREKGTNRSQFFRGYVDKYSWVDVGSSFLPGELIASYLYAQLQASDAIKKCRLLMFDRYMEALSPLATSAGVGLPVNPPQTTGNGHMFYLLMPSMQARAAFMQYMKRKGINTPFHYVPLHSSPAGRRYGRSHGVMSVTDRVSNTLVRLPLFFDLDTDIEMVIEATSVFLDAQPVGVRA